MMLVMLPLNMEAVYANSEYYEISSPVSSGSYSMGSDVDITITPRKFVSSQWTSWSNYPNFIFVEIYCGGVQKYTTKIGYNIDGKSINSFQDHLFIDPAATGETVTRTFTPDAAGKYEMKILWQNYDSYNKNTAPALQEEFSFNVKEKKAANPLTVKAKTATIKYSKLKKKAQKLAVTKVIKFTKKGQGKMSYTLVSAKKGGKNFKKKFAVSKSTGKVTVKKGLKKGTYKVKIKVNAAGNGSYNKATKSVTVTIKVK